MGIRGLKSFVEKNPDLFIREYHLHDTHIIVDAANLAFELFTLSQKHERRDLFGGDLVQFGRFVGKFFDHLERCKIKPILVFDGAQTHDKGKSKTAEKHRRALEKFLVVMSINKSGFGDFILPASATNVFRSIAVDRNIQIIQCMFEADLHVARIAKDYRCPVLSNDSDFFLIDLPDGLILIDLLDYVHIHSVPSDLNEKKPVSYQYLNCSLYKRENFSNYIPRLDIRNLPLLGALAGNDFTDIRVFERICSMFSRHQYIQQGGKEFKKTKGKQEERIVKILYFLCDKTLNEAVNQVCSHVPKLKQKALKDVIKNNLAVYEIPKEDDFKTELIRLYPIGKWRLHNKDQQSSYEDDIEVITNWLKNAMERSVMRSVCLELAHRNPIFIISHMDDPQLLSAHKCQLTAMRVMMSLLRSTDNDNKFCIVYDRVGQSYQKTFIRPKRQLDYFGKIDTNIFGLSEMTPERRRSLLLASFHCSGQIFDENVVDHYHWLEANHAEEFLMIKLLMDFIDYESKARLWKQFRQATLLCMLYHFNGNDEILASKLEQMQFEEFMTGLGELIKRRHFNKMPTLSKRRKYNCRLMHQITQLQSSIISFNSLNALLGDTMTRIRQEGWLNSCIIYNMAEGLRQQTLKLPELPSIVHNTTRRQNDNICNKETLDVLRTIQVPQQI